MTEEEVCPDEKKSVQSVYLRQFVRLPYAESTLTQVTFLLFGIFGYHLSHFQVSSGEYRMIE